MDQERRNNQRPHDAGPVRSPCAAACSPQVTGPVYCLETGDLEFLRSTLWFAQSELDELDYSLGGRFVRNELAGMRSEVLAKCHTLRDKLSALIMEGKNGGRDAAR